MNATSCQNRRIVPRPPHNYDNPAVFSDNTLGTIAYIHPEGEQVAVVRPRVGLVNECNELGCSIVLTDDLDDALKEGASCYLRLEPGRHGRAVVRWRLSFGHKAAKVGFEYID